MQVVMPLGWGAGGRGDVDRDIRPLPIAGMGHAGDGGSEGGMGDFGGAGEPACCDSGAQHFDEVARIDGRLPALPMALVPIPRAIEAWLHLGALH